MSISLYIYISMQYRYVLGMYTFAKTFTVFLAFLHPINAHSFAALKVAWLDCAEDSVLPPSTGRSPIILSALGENIVCSPQELTFYAAFWKTKRSTVIATLTRREQPTLQFHFATLVRKRSEKMNRMLGIYRRKRESTKQGTMKVPASHEQKFQVCVNCTAAPTRIATATALISLQQHHERLTSRQFHLHRKHSNRGLLGVSFNRKTAADMPEIHHTPRPVGPQPQASLQQAGRNAVTVALGNSLGLVEPKLQSLQLWIAMIIVTCWAIPAIPETTDGNHGC